MRASKLLIELTVYYVVIGLALFLALKAWPELRGYMPLGGVEQLITQPAKNPLEATEAVRAAHVANLGQSIFWLSVAIVAAILSMANSLGIQVIAEGVETEDQLDWLRDHDCQFAQGYLFSPPVTAGELVSAGGAGATMFS